MEHSLERVITALFLLFIFLLPWQTQWIIRKGDINGEPFEYGTLSLYVTDILLWFIAGLFILWLLHQQKKTKHPKEFLPIQSSPVGKMAGSDKNSKIKKSVWLLVSASLLYVLASSLFAQDSVLAILTWLSLLESVFIVAFLIRFPIPLSRVIHVLLFAAGIQALLAISQIATQIIPANTIFGIALHEPWQGGSAVIETGTTRLLRAYGSLPHPNVLGGFLAMTLFLCVVYASQKKTLTARHVFLFITTILLTLGLLFSFSRSAWLGFVFGLLLFVVLRSLPPLRGAKGGVRNTTHKTREMSPSSHSFTSLHSLKIIIAIIAVTSFVGGFFGRDIILTRLLASGRLEHASFNERVLTYQEAWTLFKAHPLRGVGLGNYTPALAQVFPQKPVFEYQPVHNVFLLILVELGSIGFSLIVFALVFLFIHLRGRIDKHQTPPLAPPQGGEIPLLERGKGVCNLHVSPNLAKAIPLLAILITLLSLDHYLWSLHFGRLFFGLILGIFTSYAVRNFSIPTRLVA